MGKIMMKHSASVLVRDSENRALLLKRNGKGQRFHGLWEFPGGKIDEGQTAGEAARREAMEEARLDVPEFPEEPEIRIATANGEVEYSFFTWDCPGPQPDVCLSEEHTAFRWAKPTELRELAEDGEMMLPHFEFFERNWLERQVEAYAGHEFIQYKKFAETLAEILHRLCTRWAPLTIVQARAKAPESFAGKCLRKADKYDDPVRQFTDLCGGRMIAITERETRRLCRQVRKIFDIVEHDDTGKRHASDAFGYLSVHFLVRIPEGRNDVLGVPVPSGIGRRVAEIQVRTLLQHAHSEVTHDRLYKSGFTPPEHSKREAARVAAVLETADIEFGCFVEKLDAYVGEYAAQMNAAERKRMIDDQLLLIELEKSQPGKAKMALKIARLARSAWDWEMVVEALGRILPEKMLSATPDDCEGNEMLCPKELRMEFGHALCRMHYADAGNPEFQRGVALLESVARPEHGFDRFLEDDERICRAVALGRLGRALMRMDGHRDMARKCLQGAIRLAPEDPYHLCSLVELDVIAGGSGKHLDLLVPSLRMAAGRCEGHIRAGIEINRAWFALAKIRLFLGDDREAFEALCLGVRSTENPRPLSDVQHSLALFVDAIGDERPQAAILERVARLFVADGMARSEEEGRIACDWSSLNPLAEFDPTDRILIIADATGEIEIEQLAKYESLLRTALDECHVRILSGGTTAGICGVVAQIARERMTEAPEDSSFFGYVPENAPTGAEYADESLELVRTPGADRFSLHEPLQMWTDLLASGVDPHRVMLLCLGGGDISSSELALAWAFGARVAVVDDGSVASRRFANLLDWAGEDRGAGMLVPDDPATFSALLSFQFPDTDAEWGNCWEEPGKAVHESYLRIERKRAKEPNLLPWNLLPPKFRHSNRHQAFNAVQILREHGFEVEKIELEPKEIPLLKFTDGDADLIEFMAEAEHGRWNAERLYRGWRKGERKNAAQKTSPYVVPWTDLSDNIKGYDRNAVRQWPKILAIAGWMVKRI